MIPADTVGWNGVARRKAPATTMLANQGGRGQEVLMPGNKSSRLERRAALEQESECGHNG